MASRKQRIGTGPSRREALADSVPRPVKRQSGRTATSQTPLAVRTQGLKLADSERGYLRVRLGKKLGKFAAHIERVTARLMDINGPRGGVDIACRIKVVLSGRPSVIVEERAQRAQLAFNRAADRAERAVKQALDRSDARTPKRSAGAKPTAKARTADASRARAAQAGSHIGRRVGRSKQNLKRAAERPEKRRGDALVNTQALATSASDRKVGAGATATRNTRINDAGMTYTLEDSIDSRPSRKSKRRSSHRVKTDSNLRRRTMREVRSPSARARRAAASRKPSS